MTVHARLAPSAAARWMICPAAPRLETETHETADITISDVSKAAELGTSAHAWLEQCLRLGITPAELPWPEAEQQRWPDDLIDSVDRAYRWVVDTFPNQATTRIWIERRLAISPAIGRKPADLFGTADIVIHDEAEQRLHVIDFKSGMIPVATDSPQLKIYALGAVHWLKHEPIKSVRLTVLQPRYYHVDGWARSCDLAVADLAAFGVQVARAARATDSPDAEPVPGEHCRWCLARVSCRALFEHNKSLIEGALEGVANSSESELVAEADIAWVLRQIEQITAWMRSIERHALTLALAGKTIPGYKLIDSRSQRAWTSSQAAERLLTQLGVNAWVEKKVLRSPALAEKAVREAHNTTLKAARAMIAGEVISERHKKLAPNHDGRQAVTPHDSREDLQNALADADGAA